MALATIEHAAGQSTVINTDQITYIRQDNYGTVIHFASGDHVVCALDIDTVMERLGSGASEELLVRPD
jgi:uncharacterized protein YlzI (FlbEa/FlbD family)